MRHLLLAFSIVACPLMGQGVASVPISMSPGDGIQFTVDGQIFTGSGTFLWPQGSKHTVSVSAIEYGNTPRAQYQFVNWTINTAVPQMFTPSTLIVTADPSITSIVANFNTLYEFDVIYFACPTDGSACASPGTVYINNVATNQTSSQYIASGTAVNVLVQPNPGFIFTGWIVGPGANNSSQGFANTFTMTGPIAVYPQFLLSHPITIGLSTAPASLQILADHTLIASPVTLDWGTGTVHSVSVGSPQTDATGNTWVFQSWSDGGAQLHDYTVPDGTAALSLTATFVPAYRVTFATNPPGLSLAINGRSNWPNLTFTGGAGTKYQLSAPTTQVDAQGRTNQFVSWSNGGTQTQTYIQPAADDRITATYQTLGHLRLTSVPLGISLTVNGQSCVTPCDFDQPAGTQVIISANPSIPLNTASRLDFQGWQDSPSANRVVTTTAANQSLTATYQTMYLVASTSEPAAAGSVVFVPPSPDGFYPANSSVLATVSQNPGFQFKSWKGDLAGSQLLAGFNITSPKAIGAVFASVPYLPPASVLNAAGSTPVDGVAPGSIVSIFGLNLADGILAGSSSPLSQALLNVTATVGAQILPLYFVSPGQINVQLPYETALGQQTLVLHRQGQPDASAVFSAVRNAPGIFSVAHADGTVVTASNPARAAEVLTISGTGFGPYDRNPPDGIAIPANATFALLDPVTVTAGGISAPALSFGPAFASVGMNIATFAVPSSLPSGTSVPLFVTINGADSNQLSLFLQ